MKDVAVWPMAVALLDDDIMQPCLLTIAICGRGPQNRHTW